MEIHINRESTTPLYQQMRNVIRDQILSGQIADGFKLPSERQLVEKLGVHRNTVKKAYEMLIREGLIYSSVKSPRGYFVKNSSAAEVKPDGGNQGKRPFSSLDKNFNYHFLGMQNTFQRLYNSSYLSDGIPFAGVLANREALPVEYLKEILKEISEGDSVEPYWFCDPQGTERFRNALSDMLFERNLYAAPQNIQVISETYEALSNIAFMYLKEGDYAVVEEPAIPAVVNILLHTGAHVLFVPVEKDGMKMEILESLAERYHPRLFSMDHSSSVIYIDSFNLSFFPGARVGYMVAPDNVIRTYRKIINKDQLFLGTLGQYMWARFYEKGYYEAHRKFLTVFYRRKRDLMAEELAKLPGLSFDVPEGGLVFWVRLPVHVNDRQVAAAAERKGLLVMPGNTFFVEGGRGESYLRLSFSSASDEQITEGVYLLGEIIEKCKNDL